MAQATLTKPLTRHAPARTPPGPPGDFLVGGTRAFLRDPIGALCDAWRKYGDVVRFRFAGGREAYVLAHPEHAKYVLQDQKHNYRKTPLEISRFREIVGNGLFTSEGDFWLRQRRLVQPAFHRQRIAALGTTMTDATLEMVDRWQIHAERGRPIDLGNEMRNLGMQIVARSLFSSDLRGEIEGLVRAVRIGLEWVNQRLYNPYDPRAYLPVPATLRFRAAQRSVEATVSRLIDERRRAGTDAGDLLSMLLAARDEETGEGMSDRQLRDEVVTLFLAGIDTTANALSWAWYLLSLHPESARRLRAELAEVLGGRTPTVHDLPNLRYTSWVVDEALRLYPPAWAMSRTTVAADEIGGYRIPAGRPVYLVQYLAHRHPAFWDNPEGFDPERFSPQHSAGRPRYAYFPFGGGPRQCVGNAFALVESQLVLATVAQRYRLDLVPGLTVVPRPLVALRPHPGVFVTLAAIER